MGLTVLDVEVANPSAPETTRAVRFLIDSGAIYSVVPAAILEELASSPWRRRVSAWPTALRFPARRAGLFSNTKVRSALPT